MNLLQAYLTNERRSVGSLYPISLIETMRVNTQTIPLWHWHQDRLKNSLQYLEVEATDINRMIFEIDKEIGLILNQQCSWNLNYKLRIALNLTDATHYTICTEVTPITSFLHHPPYNVLTFQSETLPQPYMALKCNKRHQYLQATTKLMGNVDNIILLRNDKVVDALNGNVLMWKDTTLHIPSLYSGGVAGTMLQYILDYQKKHKLFDINIQTISNDALISADAIWITNALRGIVPVATINAATINYQPYEAYKIKILTSLYF